MKKLIILLAAALSLIFSACELDSYLFNPEEVTEYKLPGNDIPDSLLEQVSFKSGGNTLYGYWIKSNGKRPGITMLYCEGNKHGIDNYWDRMILLHQLGINIFIFDYRGYGKSEGESTSEDGLLADARAAMEYIKHREEYNPDSLCLYGYSLGNVASIYLASEIVNPLCLISECPFASANSLTQGALVLDIPSQWVTTSEFNNVKRVTKIKTPFLLFHGSADDFVRYNDNGRIVFESAPEPKKLILVNNAVHTDIPYVLGPGKYLKEIQDWLNFSLTVHGGQ